MLQGGAPVVSETTAPVSAPAPAANQKTDKKQKATNAKPAKAAAKPDAEPVDPLVAELEQRQERILARLNQLKQEVDKLAKNAPAPKPASVPAAASATTTTVSSSSSMSASTSSSKAQTTVSQVSAMLMSSCYLTS